MSAAIWEPGTALVANSQASIAPQRFTATAGQTLFPLTVFSYVPNSNSLWVFVNGVFQKSGIDYSETSTTSFTLTTGCNVGDVVDAIGMVSVTGTGMALAGASDLLFTPDATYDIGKAAGTNRPRDVVASRDVYSGSLTASLPVFSDANKRLVSNAMTGSGSVVMSASPTLTGAPTIGAALATSINFGQSTLNYYGTGTWTPVDGSGAGLVLTVTANSCVYTKIGDTCMLGFSFQYPVTANGSTATISGRPFNSSTTITDDIGGGAPSRNNKGSYLSVVINGNNTTTIEFRDAANTSMTNANMSSVFVRGLLPYKTA